MDNSESQQTLRLHKKFQEQLRFIRRSCDAYDRGAEDEAVRIAVSLRILFHNTERCTSLVSHLKLSDKMILSSSQGHGDWKDYLSEEINLHSAQPVRMLPRLGNSLRMIAIDDWWSREPVFVHNGQQHPRKKIILSAANKDGGAHVDNDLEEYYEFLCSGVYALSIKGNLTGEGTPIFPQGIAIFPNNAHLALLRQFAHEALADISLWSPNCFTHPE